MVSFSVNLSNYFYDPVTKFYMSITDPRPPMSTNPPLHIRIKPILARVCFVYTSIQVYKSPRMVYEH